MDEFEFVCPRCGNDVQERFYGPCTDCLSELRRDVRGHVFQQPQQEAA